MKKFLIVVAAVLLAACLIGCSSSKKASYKAIEIALEENPTTGFKWEARVNESVLQLVEDEYVSNADKKLAGAGGVRNLTFIILDDTKITEIYLYYRRSWEPFPQTPTRVFIYDPATGVTEV